MSRKSIVALTALSSFVLGCAPLTGQLAKIENLIIFQPSTYPEGDWRPEPQVEDVWIEESDGVWLHGWLAQARRRASRAVVLYTHGNGGNITNRRNVIQLYRDRMNVTVLIFDYRGYGRSEGHPTELGILADARAARRFLASKTSVGEREIVLAGHSLGGGVAVDLAATDGARGLILEGTFTNLPDVAASFFPLLPVRAVMQARLDSIAKIPAYNGPLLQVHGDADEIVPYELGRKLFNAANEPKQFVTIPGGDHNHNYSPEYLSALDHFFNALNLPESSPSLSSPPANR